MRTSRVEIRKSLHRKDLRNKLRRLKPEARKRKSRRIAKKLLASRDYRASQKIAVYVSKSGEVDTRFFIQSCLKDGKLVFVPKIHQRKRKIELYQITNFRRDLRRGAFGILEPRAFKKRKSSASKMDLIIVPGLGFDRKGRRLGRGGGYFDRFLVKAKKSQKIGVAFREQMLRQVPVERHDVKINRIITD